MVERKIYLDYLKVFSCFSVLLLHILVTARTDFPIHSTIQDLFTISLAQILHYSVPIFFMVTGNLLLNKDKEISLKKLYQKYILKYVLAIVIFGFFYAFLEELFISDFSLKIILTSFLNMLSGKTWAHMWYLYTLVGILMVIPIVKKIIENDTDDKIVKYMFYLLLVSSFIMPMFENLFNFKIGIVFPMISAYLAYLLLGYLLEKQEVHNKIKLILVLILNFILIILFNIIDFKYKTNLSFFGNYNSLIVMSSSICIFLLFKQLNNNSFITKLRPLTYGVYLVHMFWINLIYKFFKFNIYGKAFFMKVLILFIIISILSFLTSFILKKIAFIKKII